MKIRTAIAPTTSESVPIASAGGLTFGEGRTARTGRKRRARLRGRRALVKERGAWLGGRCGRRRRSARAGYEDHGREREEREPAEDEEPDHHVCEDLQHGAERGERAGDGLGRVPGLGRRVAGEDRDRRDRHRNGREIGPLLDAVDLTGELLDLSANVRERRVHLEDLVDRVRLGQYREVALLFRLLGGETRLEIDELVGDILGAHARRLDLTLERPQLLQRVREPARWHADGEACAAGVAASALGKVENVAAALPGERRVGRRDVQGLVPTATGILWGEIGGIGLSQETIDRDERRRRPQPVTSGIRERARERDVDTEVEPGGQLLRSLAVAVDHPADLEPFAEN